MVQAVDIARGAPLPPLPLLRKLAYGSGVFGISMAQMSVTVLMLYFYTDVVGLPPQVGGTILALGAMMDATASLSAAWLSSKQWSRLGSYRPFLLFVPVPLTLSFAAMFFKPGLSGSALFAWAFVTHMAYRACYAFTLMPHSSLITRLSTDADERASIGAIKALCNNLGLLLAGYIGISAIEELGGHDPSRGFMIFGIVFGCLVGASILISGLFTQERVREDHLLRDTSSLPAAMRLIAGNSQLVTALLATLIFFIGYVMLNGGIVYYFKYIVGRPADAKLAIVAIGVGGILSPPLWHRVIRRTSKALAWTIGSVIMALAFVALQFSAGFSAVGLSAIYLFMGIGKTAMIVNYYAMTADAVDYGQWKQGRRTEAYGFGMLSLVTKLGAAIGGGLLGWLLGWAGYVANRPQQAETITHMSWITCALPAAVITGSGLTILMFRVNAQRHRNMMAELR